MSPYDPKRPRRPADDEGPAPVEALIDIAEGGTGDTSAAGPEDAGAGDSVPAGGSGPAGEAGTSGAAVADDRTAVEDRPAGAEPARPSAAVGAPSPDAAPTGGGGAPMESQRPEVPSRVIAFAALALAVLLLAILVRRLRR